MSSRELSEAQLRTRLERREIRDDDIDAAIARLKADRTLDDRRVARAVARMESAIKHRGRARVLQKIKQIGIDGNTAAAAVREVFEDVDEDALLERAMARRLRGRSATELDDKGRARIVRGLVAQGFAVDAVVRKLRN